MWGRKVVVRYSTSADRPLDTSQEKLPDAVSVPRDVEALDLSKRAIDEIDLQPLRLCTRLQSLDLELNDITVIDLSPLAFCLELQRLVLSHNRLHAVDLTPLGSCRKLEELYLGYNKIGSIHLQPLRTCTNLKELSLRNNDLFMIDISHLQKCSQLEKLNLDYNDISKIDLNPLSLCHSLQSLRVFQPNFFSIKLISDSWAPLRTIASTRVALTRVQRLWPVDLRIQYALLQNLDLLDFGVVDASILKSICSIPPETSLDDAKEAVRSIVIKKMCEQIDGGGPTIGLDIDKLIDEGKHGKLIARVELVDELRHEEMIRVTVPHVEEYHEDYHGEDETYEAYDLRGLWLTDYGFHILKELGMSLSTNENGLKRVTKALKDIGYEIPVGHRMFFSEVPMSQEMQELIWDTVR